MSSFSSNSESVVFQIRGSDLNQFYKTNNSQYFTSKSFVINNVIHFQVYIYPNGIDKKNIGNVQFIVVPTQFESSLKSVTVSVKLYSRNLQIMFKEVQTLHKISDTIEWSQYQLQLSECQKIIIENAIKYLDFVCDIEVLKIKYKSNNSVSRKWSLQSIRKQSSSSLASMDINVFQPLSNPVKSHVHIEWVITNDMIHIFKNTLNGKSYYSQDINKTWCLCVLPNGSKRDTSGGTHFELILKLLRLPPEIKTIAVDFAVQRYTEQPNELTQTLVLEKNILFNYKNTQSFAKLFKTIELNKFDAFKLRIVIKITKVYKDIGKNGMGEEVSGLWSNYGLDEFPPGQFEFKIDCGQNTNDHDHKNNDYYVDDAKTSSSMGNITENIPSLPSSKSLPSNVTRALLQKDMSYSTHSGRNAATSITSYQRLSLSSSAVIPTDIKKDSYLKPPAPKPELWDHKSNTFEEKDKYDNNKFTDKFKSWLCDDVQKGKYLQNFMSNGCADIRCIKRLNDSDLIACGIHNEYDRQLILDEVELFKQGQDDLNKLYEKRNELKSFRKQFRNNAIFTLDDLMSVTQQELHNVLNIEVNDTRVIEIWNILHPSQSQQYIPQTDESISQSEMNKYQQEYKLSVASIDTLIPIMIEMHKQKSKSVVQQQATSLLYSHWSRVLDQKLTIDELFNKTKPELSTTPDLIVKDRSFSQSKSSFKKRGSIQQSQSSSQNISSSSSQTDVEFQYSHIDDSNKILENDNERSNSNKSEIIKKSYPKVKESPFVLGQLGDNNDNHASK